MKKVFLAIAAKAGIDANNPAFKKFVETIKEDGDLPADLKAAIDAAPVLSLEEAKEHPDVKAHFKNALYTPTDAKVLAALKANGFTDDEAKAVVNGKASPDKIDAALTAIAGKLKDAGTKTATEREKQLETEYKTLELAKGQLEQQFQTLQGNFGQYKQTAALRGFLSSQKLRTDIGADLMTTMGLTAIEKAAKKVGAAVLYDEETDTLKLVNAKDPSAPYYAEGAPTQAVQFADFAAKALDTEKLLNRQPVGGKTDEPTNLPIHTGGGSNPQRSSLGSLVSSIEASGD